MSAALAATVRAAARLAVAGPLALAALHGGAAAHARLRSTIPPADGTIGTSPSELLLAFSEGVEPRFTGVVLTGSDGAVVPTGSAHLKPGGDDVLVVPIPARLSAGSYVVDWHALAIDGHKTAGRFRFVVRP